MRRASVWLLALAACGGGGETSPDAGQRDRADAHSSTDAAPGGPTFDHFSFAIEPAVPLVGNDFTLSVTAHDSADDSSVLDIDGTISVSTSVGEVSGQTTEATLSGGTAQLTLQLDTAADAVTLTVTEDTDPELTGTTEPFRVSPPGDAAEPLDVVINEVNWFGNGTDSSDEWIELRNVSGAALNLSEWTIENAASSGSAPVRLENGTTLEAGAYLVIGRQRGADEDGERTSLTGVEDVQLHSVELANSGETLVLRDPELTVIDETPSAPWPAGDGEHARSMERRDDLTGGGYADGAEPGSWYTWSSLDGADTTSAATRDAGTPGAANTDPDLFDHFTIAVAPNPPVAEFDFTMTVTAYSSADDSQVIETYDGTISVTASAGSLTGEVEAQPITAGAAELTLQSDTAAEDVVLTVTDDVYSAVTGDLVVTIRPEGDAAGPRDVVISEVNWYGNSDSGDEWIELRNISGGTLNLAGWTIANAGFSDNAVALDSGTELADGAYAVVGAQQGPDADGERTSLTGVSNVQLHSLQLSDDGEELLLHDVEGTLIDATPAGDWPAGDDREGAEASMERFDDLTGGGYADGTSADSWYTWNQFADVDTTHPDTSDRGTPGANNSDPFPPPDYASGFETGDPLWENTTNGGFSNAPPPGTSARTGTAVVTTDSVTTSLSGREVRSVDCLALLSDSSPVGVEIFATASTENGGNALRGRPRLLFYDDAECTNELADLGPTLSTPLPQGSYEKLSTAVDPPAGATHFKIWFQVADDNGTPDDGDGWAADDVAAFQ